MRVDRDKYFFCTDLSTDLAGTVKHQAGLVAWLPRALGYPDRDGRCPARVFKSDAAACDTLTARATRVGGGLALEPAAALRSCLGGAARCAAAAARADVLLAALAAGGAPGAGFGSLMRSLLEPGDAAQGMANGDAAPAACAGDAAAEGFGDGAAEGFQRAAAPFPMHRRLELAALAVDRLALTLDAPSAAPPAQQARAADLGAKAPSGGAAGAKGAPASTGAAAWRSEALDRAAAALAGGALLRAEPAAQQV